MWGKLDGNSLDLVQRRYDFRSFEELGECLDREIRHADGSSFPSCEGFFHLSVRLVEGDTIVDRHGVAVFVDEVVVIIVYMMHVGYEINIEAEG